MEFIERKAITDVSAGGTTFPLDFVLPAGMTRWSLHLLPKHAGGAIVDPNANIQYFIDGAFRTVNPAASGTAPRNVVSIFTREDAISRVRIQLTTDAGGGPDGEFVVELFGARPSN